LLGVPGPMRPLVGAALPRGPGLRPPAAQLGAQAAALDPDVLVQGAVLGGNAVAGPFPAVPATSADVAPAAAAQDGDGLATPGREAGLAGVPGMVMGPADPGGAAGVALGPADPGEAAGV